MGYTYNEIISQYEALELTKGIIESSYTKINEELFTKTYGEIVFIGCGSSYSLAKSCATIVQMHGNISSRAIAGGDLLLHAQRYSKNLNNTLIVSLSRSGSTSEIVMATKKLKELGVDFKLLSFSCVENSLLSKVSDFTIEMPWAFDQSVCQTRTVTNLYFGAIYLLSKLWNKQDWVDALNSVIIGGPDYLNSYENLLKEVSEKDWDNVVVLGDAEIAGICEEGSLAFKEICQLSSSFFHVLDYRHGPMVLLNKKTLLIMAISDHESKLELNLIDDILKKCDNVLIFSDEAVNIENTTNIIFGKPLPHLVKGVPFVLICQLLSYYKTFQTNTDPDCPGDLAPWISL